MTIKYLAAAILAGTALAATTAQAATTYANRAAFSATLAASMTDNYENAGYSFIQSNAAMTAVLGQTRYQTTGFPNLNIVQGGPGAHSYCAGCNGSFNLYFDNTSYGTSNGVFGVGFDIILADSFDGFVTYGDGSTENFAGLGVGFFGLTSTKSIKSIAFGPNGGQPTTSRFFAIDNLTIGTAGAVPEPASWAMMIGGFALAGGALRRRSAAVRFA